MTTEDNRRKFALLVNKINSLIFSVHPSSFRLPGYIASLDLVLQWNKAEYHTYFHLRDAMGTQNIGKDILSKLLKPCCVPERKDNLEFGFQFITKYI